MNPSNNETEMFAQPVGAQLQQARKDKGLSHAEIQARLNIAHHHIVALEAGDYQRLPAEIFVRGYLKNYAALVGLSVDELLADYADEIGRADNGSLQPSPWKVYLQRTPQQWPSYLVLALVFTLPMTWWSSQPEGPEQPQVELAGQATDLLAPALETIELDLIDERIRMSGLVADDRARADQLTPFLDITEDVINDDLNNLAKWEAPAVALDIAPESEKTLNIRFVGHCWLEVRDSDKKLLFSGVRKPGEHLRLKTSSHFAIILGDPAAVVMTLDKTIVDVGAYTDDQQMARLTLGG